MSKSIIFSMILVAITSNVYIIFSTLDITCLIYFLLFLKVRYPFNVIKFYELFKNFQYAFIPNVYLPLVDSEYFQESSPVFMAQDTDLYFFKNAGQSFTIISIVICMYMVMKLINLVKKWKKLDDYISKKLKNTWEYCGFFDLVCTVYIYVAFGALLQFYSFEFTDRTCFINYCLHSFFTLFIFVYPVCIGVYINK